jgi:hypothetical protein
MILNEQIVTAAREWIDTPFQHLGRLKGVAVDCAGVLIGVCRRLGTVSPDFDITTYSPVPDGHSMVVWCETYMKKIDASFAQPGNAILLAVDEEPQHLGILGNYLYGGLSIIHASSSAHPPRVIETRLMFSRIQRLISVYELPGEVKWPS